MHHITTICPTKYIKHIAMTYKCKNNDFTLEIDNCIARNRTENLHDLACIIKQP